MYFRNGVIPTVNSKINAFVSGAKSISSPIGFRVFICRIRIRGSYSKKFLPTSGMTFDIKGAHFENDIASEKWL